MLDLLHCSAWWREQCPPYSTAEIHLVQLSREAIRETIRESAALHWRAWLQKHAPTLVGQIGLDAVEPLEEGGYQLTRRAAEAAWRYPDLTPGAYFSAGWSILDREGSLAHALVRSWARTYPRSPAMALLILRGAARIEELLGERLDPLPIETWFVEGDHLDERALAAFCAALTTFRAQVGQRPEPGALSALRSNKQPTRVIHLAATLLAPLHAEGRAVPGFLASWYLRQVASPARAGEEAPDARCEDSTRQALHRITDLLRAFQQLAWGHLPPALEAQVQGAMFPADLEPSLQRLVSETLPAFLQASGGQRLPLALLEALPLPLDGAEIRALAAVFSWSVWKRLLERFQAECSFDLKHPPSWAVQGACALLVIFGRSFQDWVQACEQKQRWGMYEASHWLPLTPAPGLGAWLLRHVETAQGRLAWVAEHWQDAGFPQEAKLSQMRLWELEGLVRKEAPGVPEAVVEHLLPLMAYELEPATLCAAVQQVLPALRGEIPLDPRLVGCWEPGEGRLLRFLAKTDPLGLALGEATNCCQQWGGVGQACMEAGYVRPDSAFLVLEHGEQLLAQAWVWIGAGRDGEALVLDNIEVPHSPRLSPNEVLAVVRSWAGVYAQEKGLGVKLGTGSADYLLSDLLPAPTSQLEDYAGYSDATYQRWLALPPALAALPIGVRLATELDAYALSALEREIYPAALCTGVEVRAGHQGFTLLYEEEGQRLGYVTIQFGYDWQERTEGYVEDLAVLPSARRRAVFPLAEAFHRFATTYGLTHLRAHLRETTSYRLLSRHGARLGLVIEQEEGWEERACGERFMAARIRIEPARA